MQELELLGVPDSRDAATPRKKQALPRPVEIEKPAGCSGAKLTADSIDTPFHYITNYLLEQYLLKVKGCNVFLYDTVSG